MQILTRIIQSKYILNIQTPESDSALSSSKIGSKSLRSVGADVGKAEAATRPEVGGPEVETSYAREDISVSASDSSSMTFSFNMVGGVSKILRSVKSGHHS